MRDLKNYAQYYDESVTPPTWADTLSDVQVMLQNVRGGEFGIKAEKTITPTIASDSHDNSSTLYFTPFGIMMGGVMIAQPTPFALIDEMKEQISNATGALKYVGTIGNDGYLNSANPTEIPDVVTRTIANRMFMTTSSVGTVGEYPQFGNIGNIDAIDIQQFCDALANNYAELPDANEYFKLIIDGVSGEKARLYIPKHNGSTYAPVNKVITLPYVLTTQDVQDLYAVTQIQAAYNRTERPYVFLRDNDLDIEGHADIVGHSGDFLLGKPAIFVKYTQQTSPVTFQTLPSYTDVHSGYVFMVQGNATLISGDSSTKVYTGDMVIVNVDKTKTMGTSFTSSDFTIIASSANNIANRRSNGLMSSEMFAILDALGQNLVTEDYELIKATYDTYGVVKVAKKDAKTQGLTVSDGSLSLNLGVKCEDTLNQGVSINLYDVSSNTNITKSSQTINPLLPVAGVGENGHFGVIKVDGTTIIIDNNGVVSATAQPLVWS